MFATQFLISIFAARQTHVNVTLKFLPLNFEASKENQLKIFENEKILRG